MVQRSRMRCAHDARPGARSRRRDGAAVKVKRSRAVPAGTVGGRIATTRKPSASSSCEASSAASASPITTGTIGLCASGRPSSAGEGARLGERQRRIGRIALDQVERRDRGRDGRRRQAGRIDQACARGCGSDRSPRSRRRDSRRSRRSPSTACPSAAARRPSRRAQRSSRGRRRPRRCHGRRRSSARRRGRCASAASSGSGARSPSMENTPSVAISARGWRARCSASSASTCADVVVAERQHGGARQPRAGPQAGMRQLVDQHQVVAADQRRNDAGIGEIAGAEHAGRLGALEPGEPRFELGEQRMIAGHEPRGAGADAIALRSPRSRRP